MATLKNILSRIACSVFTIALAIIATILCIGPAGADESKPTDALLSDASGDRLLAADLTRNRLGQAAKEAEQSGAVEMEQNNVGSAVAPMMLPVERRNRIDLSGTYEYLHPHGNYGSWQNVTIAFYRRERPDFTWFAQLGGHSRKEGAGLFGAAGAYKDWTPWLYTYSALSAGTNSDYLPQLRVDHDFNIKLGPDRNFVWTIGGTYIRYFDEHRDYIVSTGLAAYLGKWVAEYRVFRNISDPGSRVSYSQLFGLSYGQDGWQWTYGKLSFGKQAYLSTALETPEAINNNSVLATFGHRRWLGSDYGVFGEVGYFTLSNAYHKYGLTLGVFKEF
ncbi:MAG TPA: YaiO family outer membrane beta-barrel protein [Dissulfurispiraceae bacterium]|nr:YaiO family outer membrane beta-barrel protein [Dissulfurispiraceae bacterium]